jgi:DNA (cytosine-5)-methyltransferase 1
MYGYHSRTMSKRWRQSIMFEVAEIFCGAGGMTLGLQQSGMTPKIGIDLNPHCISTYSRNFKKSLGIVADIADVRANDILSRVQSRHSLVLAGCPPCQPFSRLHRKRCSDVPEFDHYLRLIWSIRPQWIVFENVPRMRTWTDLWSRLEDRLDRMGYNCQVCVIDAHEFGVPQRRQRLILVASPDEFDLAWPNKIPASTVRKSISHLPFANSAIPNHISMTLSHDNLARIQKTTQNGGISKPIDASFHDSYARMHWDEPAPTITTKCISFSNGRFGHPHFDRAVTVREAAILQGFPMEFVFDGPLKETARQVGNAVPPPVARWIGNQICEQRGQLA